MIPALDKSSPLAPIIMDHETYEMALSELIEIVLDTIRERLGHIAAKGQIVVVGFPLDVDGLSLSAPIIKDDFVCGCVYIITKAINGYDVITPRGYESWGEYFKAAAVARIRDGKELPFPSLNISAPWAQGKIYLRTKK